MKSGEQKADLQELMGKDYDGYLDYATGWHYKAAHYLNEVFGSQFAFVSTNSITQGQPVPALFKPLFGMGWKISFAHQTFAWNAQSTDMAHVQVVIIGMSKGAVSPVLFEYSDIKGEPISRKVDNINGYLVAGPNLFIEKRTEPLSDLSEAKFGIKPADGGHLILNTAEDYAAAMADPIAAKYVRPFRMGKELINGIDRWCLWLQNASPAEMRKSAYISQRVAAVREFREKSSPTGDAYKLRESPWSFRPGPVPTTRYLAIPAVFSERREYATCDYYEPEIIAGNKIFVCDDPDGFNFSIIESSMYITWQKVIGGRLGISCNFSNTVVWNNLPLSQVSEELRERIINAGLSVLQARANHKGQSLADLYDPDYMPIDLRKAHIALDKVVDLAFGASKPCATNEERLQVLFNNYAEMTKSSKQ